MIITIKNIQCSASPYILGEVNVCNRLRCKKVQKTYYKVRVSSRSDVIQMFMNQIYSY